MVHIGLKFIHQSDPNFSIKFIHQSDPNFSIILRKYICVQGKTTAQ